MLNIQHLNEWYKLWQVDSVQRPASTRGPYGVRQKNLSHLKSVIRLWTQFRSIRAY